MVGAVTETVIVGVTVIVIEGVIRGREARGEVEEIEGRMILGEVGEPRMQGGSRLGLLISNSSHHKMLQVFSNNNRPSSLRQRITNKLISHHSARPDFPCRLLNSSRINKTHPHNLSNTQAVSNRNLHHNNSNLHHNNTHNNNTHNNNLLIVSSRTHHSNTHKLQIIRGNNNSNTHSRIRKQICNPHGR